MEGEVQRLRKELETKIQTQTQTQPQAQKPNENVSLLEAEVAKLRNEL